MVVNRFFLGGLGDDTIIPRGLWEVPMQVLFEQGTFSL
jgi:hypothetical protein